MSGIFEWILSLPPWVVLGLVFLLPLLEASVFVGVVFPGETAVVVGGILAHVGALTLTEVIVAAIAGAVIGDQIGYLLGRRYGPAFLEKMPRKIRDSEHVDRILDLIQRRGAFAVILGRWTAVMRAFVPGLAGMSKVSRTRFTIANIVGGVIWAVVCAVGGYIVGMSYQKLHQYLGGASIVITVLVVLGLIAWHFRETYQHKLPSVKKGPEESPTEG